ncbi:hypothetical protein CFC21_110812 [Triticum aestivum]|uniref:Regulator of Vps4 activity in the MVB pathway protein n=2 Tax=Triticum aestivum TaxID=4565 RepID=A0A9R1NEE2_WHEAT|nr:uncharacterized protein LOC123168835 [Triticum aestivum]KAF7110728.1 hypothetical protein CFC21_110812 [Triticum aestivum]
MFDGLINSKFYNRCKHAFKCIRTRLVVIRRKKQAMIGFLKKDVADLLANGLDIHAFGRMDALIMELNHASCYDMVEQYCDFLGKQLNSLQKQRDCPQEAMEAVSTLIFATARFPDLPELCDLRHIFTERYGGSLEPFVSLEFIRKLESELFTNEEKFQVMQSIAEESSVGFDMRALEIKLWAARESEDDLLEKDSMKKDEPAVPLPIKQKEDGRLNDNTGRKNSDKSYGKEQLEKSVSPLDLKRENTQKDDNTRRRHADKADGKEHLEKSVSPLQTEREEAQKRVQKLKKKDVRPSEKELMEAVELDINGLPKQGSGSVKFPETESNRIVPPIVKPKETKKERGVEKENNRGLGYHHRSPIPGRPDYTRIHANLGCKALGLQNQGPTSPNPSSGKTTNRPPPTSNPNGAKGRNCDEKEEGNSCLRDRPQHLEDLGHTVQNGQRAPHRVANVQPPYVKPKLGMQPVNDDPAKPIDRNCNMSERTDRLADKGVLRPVSVRRRPAAPSYDEAPNGEKATSQKANCHRTQPSKHKGANEDYDRKGNGVGNGRNVERTPSGRPSHPGMRNGVLYDDDYDGPMQRPKAGEDETDIDFGNMLPRTANGHHRLNSRNIDAHGRDPDEEERMMDKLLMHYSKKGSGTDETQTATVETSRTANYHGAQTQCQQNGSLNTTGRAVSLPHESISPGEAAKVPARSTSLRSDCPGVVRVHPKMPDFEELAARVMALRNA